MALINCCGVYGYLSIDAIVVLVENDFLICEVSWLISITDSLGLTFVADFLFEFFEGLLVLFIEKEVRIMFELRQHCR